MQNKNAMVFISEKKIRGHYERKFTIEQTINQRYDSNYSPISK